MIAGIVSPYSFDGSIIRFEELVKLAKAFGKNSLLLCDANFHAAVIFNKICRANGLIPIHGLRLFSKVFYARSREEFEELIRAYNENREPVTEFIPAEEVRFVYFLDKKDYEHHAIMCKLLSVEPKENGYFDEELPDTAKVLNVSPYDLKIDAKLPQPQEGWLRTFTDTLPAELARKFLEEAQIVEKLGFESYFYTVKEIVDTAKQAGICIGPGRGSAVGSVISYALGITNVNPINHGLMFERFLNEYRNEPPDIDIDVEDERRQELIEMIGKKFPFVAQVSSFSRLSEKSILNEFHRQNFSVSNETLKKMVGLPSKRSVHASGIVVTETPPNIPLVPGTRQKITEYDIYSLEDLGIVKIDLLGLTALSLLSKLKKAIKVHQIPVTDEKTYSMVQRGQTTGIFQLESPMARKLCRQVRVENIEELSILLALNRPGPLSAKLNEIYARKKRRCEKVENVFPETKGVIVYQEQLMKLAMDVAGLSAPESDLFRRAVSGKDRELMREALEKLERGMQKKGYSKEEINRLVTIIQNFAQYAFNKSHSVAYSYLSYELAYLKSLSPRIFFLEYIKRHSTERDKVFLAVQELRSLGYKVIPPSINPTKLNELDFQLPFEVIEGINHSIVETIIKNAPYSSVQDFADKIRIPISTIQKLVMAGAFDCIYENREKAFIAFESFRMGFEPSLLEISAKFGKRYQSIHISLTEKDIAKYEEESYGFPLTPFATRLDKKIAPLAEVFTTFRLLPVAVDVRGEYASDGITIFKLRNPINDGRYLLILRPNGETIEYRNLEDVISVVYEFSGCFDEKDLENATELECTRVTLAGKKLTLDAVRPILDSYSITIKTRN